MLILRNMVGKAKITDYLVKMTRPKCDAKVANPSKKARLATDDKIAAESTNVSENADLNLAQDLIANEGASPPPEHRLSAKLRLTSKRLPAVHSNMGLSWFEALEPEFSKPYFLKLNEFLVYERRQHEIYPPDEKVFTWTRMCDIREVKVVILGQDPYHGPNQAHGLSFSVQKGVPPPPSLNNMYAELLTDIPGFQKPSHGNLSGWAKQGVLLLNACLTVRSHVANSHKDKGWEQFTDAVIRWLNDNTHGLVFLLWGAYAQKKQLAINKARHHILQCPHPSPLSAHRGFFGCRHFSKANQLLLDQGKTPVDWTRIPLDDE